MSQNQIVNHLRAIESQPRIGVWKAALCSGLAAGMVLCVQPPFIFSQRQSDHSEDDNNDNETSSAAAAWNISELVLGNASLMSPQNKPVAPFTTNYYFGVILGWVH